jgi:hypothetical protein
MFYSSSWWFSLKWWLGFIPGMLFLLWCIIAYILLMTNQVSEGLGYVLLFFTGGLLILMTLVMVGLGCFKKTYPISFGLAVPLLVPNAALCFIGIFLSNQGTEFSWAILFYVLPGMLALTILVAPFFRLPTSTKTVRHR